VHHPVRVGGMKYEQTVQVGWLQGLDLLLGMDWLVTHEAEINRGRRTIRVKENPEVSFGRILAVDSKDLVRMDKTVRIRPRGVQRVSCHVRDLSKAGREVLVEGVVQLGDELYVVPSLEIVRDNGSIPLTLENLGIMYKQIKEELVVAKITDLSTRQQEKTRLADVNQASDGGRSPLLFVSGTFPPMWRKWGQCGPGTEGSGAAGN
jgi:hypothetical protein